MKLFTLISIMFVLAACQTAPPPIEFDFESFETLGVSAEHPKPLGEISELECLPTPADCQGAGYSDTADVDRLEMYKIRAEGNTEVAEANAVTIELLLTQVELLVAAGRATEHIQKIREEQLAWEREQRTREKWFHRATLLVLGAAALY